MQRTTRISTAQFSHSQRSEYTPVHLRAPARSKRAPVIPLQSGVDEMQYHCCHDTQKPSDYGSDQCTHTIQTTIIATIHARTLSLDQHNSPTSSTQKSSRDGRQRRMVIVHLRPRSGGLCSVVRVNEALGDS